MSIRRAVIQQLKNQVHALSGRVYQAFLAPVNIGTPYAAVKFATERQSANVSFAGTQTIEVYLYRRLDNFVSLDAIRQDVIKALNGVVITDSESNARFVLRWVGSVGDVVDEDRKLIGTLVSFDAATVQERGR